MPTLNVHLEGDNIWPDLVSARVIHLGNDAPPIGIAVLADGMSGGKPSVSIRVDLPNGQIVIAETSARLFCTAARMIMAKYPDLFEGD